MLIFQWLAGDIFKKWGHYILSAVIPAKAGIQNGLNLLDSRLRRNDNYMNYANQARKSGVTSNFRSLLWRTHAAMPSSSMAS